mmetsp:Transcript_53964/g.131040  ORF Transcript_53964/g.131040 Transcript_53964/m.131040 type:complete len:450 (-) Transcript_53964:1381-2730(-)
MATWPCLIGWVILVAYFLARYIVVNVLLLSTFKAIEDGLATSNSVTDDCQIFFDELDGSVYVCVASLVWALEWIRRTTAPYTICILLIPTIRKYGIWYALFNITSRKCYRTNSKRSYLTSSPSSLYLLIVTSIPYLRQYGSTASKAAAFWIEIHRLTGQIPQQKLWIWLENIITFGRISSRRACVHDSVKRNPPHFFVNPSYQLSLWLVPTLIRMSTVSLFVFMLREHLVLPSIFSNTGQTSLEHIDGYSARVSSCYDGDTCYTDQLFYDGQPLPDLFASLNIRLRGIDAPERRHRAKCPLEKCLADSAKNELEDMILRYSYRSNQSDTSRWTDRRSWNVGVYSGGSILVRLTECNKDKYGGRIVCDILLDDDLTSASTEMMNAGLAVPYSGKRKTQDWCDLDELMLIPSLVPRRQTETRTSLQKHLRACGVDLSLNDWDFQTYDINDD